MLGDICFYGLIIFIIILILIYCYIKLNHHFWSLQPVYHFYDYHYSFLSNRIIHEELPEINRYCEFNKIEYYDINKLSALKRKDFCKLIRGHFLHNRDNKYVPSQSNIFPYFKGHHSLCHISLYYEDEILNDTKDHSFITNKRLIGAMTNRPLHITFKNEGSFYCNYIDYLCVDKEYRKKGIAPQLIQTHEYNMRHSNKQIKVSLFKREGEITGIIPLCIYKTYIYDMIRWRKPDDFYPGEANIIEGNRKTMHYFLDFMKDHMKKFSVVIVPDVYNISELLRTENLYMYMLLENDEVTSIYIFQKSCTQIVKGSEGLICLGSINKASSKDMFIHGFKIALWKIVEKYKKYRHIVIEDMSDNNMLINNLNMRSRILNTVPCAYFLYNYIKQPVKSNEVFLIA